MYRDKFCEPKYYKLKYIRVYFIYLFKTNFQIFWSTDLKCPIFYTFMIIFSPYGITLIILIMYFVFILPYILFVLVKNKTFTVNYIK